MRRVAALVSSAGLLLAVTGCTSLQGTGGKNYVTGDGAVREIAPADRGQPITLVGKDLDGKPLSLATLRGKPAVVNVWWSACPPCRKETPLLLAAERELGRSAAFVGIDIRDAGTAAPKAFVANFRVPWSSFYSKGGEAVLAFAGTLTPNSVPATVVLDAQGRVAASVIGAVPTETTLVELVDRVVKHG